MISEMLKHRDKLTERISGGMQNNKLKVDLRYLDELIELQIIVSNRFNKFLKEQESIKNER